MLLSQAVLKIYSSKPSQLNFKNFDKVRTDIWFVKPAWKISDHFKKPFIYNLTKSTIAWKCEWNDILGLKFCFCIFLCVLYWCGHHYVSPQLIQIWIILVQLMWLEWDHHCSMLIISKTFYIKTRNHNDKTEQGRFLQHVFSIQIQLQYQCTARLNTNIQLA